MLQKKPTITNKILKILNRAPKALMCDFGCIIRLFAKMFAILAFFTFLSGFLP